MSRPRKIDAVRYVPTTEPPALLTEANRGGPDFLCIGAQKAGTRWLFDQLDHHPDFWMPPIKELHYFDRSGRFRKRARPLYARAKMDLARLNQRRASRRERPLEPADVGWLEARFWLHGRPLDLDLYARLFNPRGDRLSGDICPPYAIIPDRRAAAVRHRFPDAKIIYLARDPVDRFWSQYCMLVRRRGWTNPESPATVEAFVRNSTGIRHSSIRDVVARWQTGPDDAAFRVFFFDDLKRDPEGLRREVLAFLGADSLRHDGVLPAGFNRKKEQARIPISDDTRAYLGRLFADEIIGCAEMLGGAAAAWPAKYGL